MKGYVILEKGFEYNDNYYYESESGGGTPQKFYFDKERCNESCTKLNASYLKELNVQEYTDDIEDIVLDTEKLKSFCEGLIKKYGPIKKKNQWENFDEYRLHNDANEEECKQYMEMCSLRMFEIVEVETDLSDLREYKLNEVMK